MAGRRNRTSSTTTTTPLSSRNPNSSPLPPLSMKSLMATGDSAGMILPSLPTPTPSDKYYSFGVSKKNGGGDDDDNNNHFRGVGPGGVYESYY